MIRRVAVFLAVISLILSAPEISGAWEKGHIKVIPTVKTEGMWDSNIFYTPKDEKGDWVTLVSPGLLGEYGFGTEGKHKIWAGYFGEFGIFSKYDKQNYGNHTATSGLALDFEKYTLDVKNCFSFTSDRAGTEFETRVLRRTDTFSTVLGMHYNKFSVDLGYEYYYVDYLSSNLKTIDRYENTGWITGYVAVAPKTKALLEVAYKNIQYPDTGQRNANDYKIMAGVTGEITSKITGIAKVGFKLKDYVNSTHKDFAGPVAYAALHYKMTERADVAFAYTREPFESIYTGNNYYTGDHFMADLNYRLGNNWYAKLNSMYFFNWYPSLGTGEAKKRRDNEWLIGPRLEYRWKEWIITGAGYRFHQRESTLSDKDYDQHVISADIRLIF